jgi:hypothetical protein
MDRQHLFTVPASQRSSVHAHRSQLKHLATLARHRRIVQDLKLILAAWRSLSLADTRILHQREHLSTAGTRLPLLVAPQTRLLRLEPRLWAQPSLTAEGSIVGMLFFDGSGHSGVSGYLGTWQA